MAEPQIHFCTASDGVRIAYAVTGSGYPLVWVPGWISHAEIDWDFPSLRERYHALTKDFTLLRLDKRGTGLSQRKIPPYSREAYVRDVEAVVAHTRLERFALAGYSEGGPIAVEYAALHPERVSHLILMGTGVAAEDDARGRELLSALVTIVRTSWGSAVKVMSDLFLGDDAPPEAQQLFAAYQRQSANPEDAADMLEALPHTYDIGHIAPNVRAPTLLIHARSDKAVPIELGQRLASLIPDAAFKSVEGHHVPGRKQSAEMEAAIREFVLGVAASARESSNPASATPLRQSAGSAVILFTDIVDSTALTERMGDAAFRQASRTLDDGLRVAIRDAGGDAIDGKLLGDGVLATFPSAAQAIDGARRCLALSAASELGLHIGLHAGDVIREDNNVYGGAVNIASRICGLSAPGEILVSDVVRGMARSSASVVFEDRGEQEMKGVGDPVRVYAVRWRETV